VNGVFPLVALAVSTIFWLFGVGAADTVVLFAMRLTPSLLDGLYTVGVISGRFELKRRLEKVPKIPVVSDGNCTLCETVLEVDEA
jgi:hypothetical protein